MYKRRTPFHPGRLREFVAENFVFFEPVLPSEEDEEDSSEDEEDSSEGEEGIAEAAAVAASAPPPAPPSDAEPASGEVLDASEDLDWVKLEEMRTEATRNSKKFGQILRSKGFMWIATRSYGIGEWSQAGVIARLNFAGPWFVPQN